MGQVVRRYLDLPKYVDLIRSRTLYLRRADRFPDRFEGVLTPAIRAVLDAGKKGGMADHDADHLYRRSRMGTYLSCWSLGDKENMALWQIYGSASTSVTVTSTIGKLVETAIGWGERTLIRKVRYIDHFANPDMIIGTYTDALCFKHEAYGYEDEVRIMVPRQHEKWEENPDYIRQPIGDLNAMVESVVVAPEAGRWFYDLVCDITRVFGISAPVKPSKLTHLPK